MVIVMSNWMDSDGTLNDETQVRVDQACQMFMKGNIKKMLLMGWDYREDTTLCISDAMNTYLQDHYTIDPENVLIDRQSRDTVGDAVFSKHNFEHIIRPNTISVVTSDYHRSRTKVIFDFVYGKDWKIDVIGVHTNQTVDVEKKEAASLDAFWRTFSGVDAGDDIGIFKAMVAKHPYYNGDVYPRIGF
jgi:vancomycin permeability regulator SanA